MLQMLRESKAEFKKYNGTPETTIYLQQAGEKLFNAFERYLELKYERVKYSHEGIRELAYQDKRTIELFTQLELLHEYFYHGSVKMSDEQAKILYNNVFLKIESRINNI